MEKVKCECGKEINLEDALMDSDGNWNCKECIKEMVLPNYFDVDDKFKSGEKLDPIEHFIREQEPAGNEQGDKWRKELFDLIMYVKSTN